ncbi:MAG TPA: phospholipase D-like domain-containing protein, partial [Pyrinomonadaceae bacterium]
MIAYDLSEPAVVSRLEQLGPRLKILIDDSGDHGHADSGETQATQRLRISAGPANVKRQHMGQLQHNKTIVVEGPKVKMAVCGSTNYTWRGFFVQANNAVVLRGKNAIKPFVVGFDQYWSTETPAKFANTASAAWTSLGLDGINAMVAFSPHSEANPVLKFIADDIGTKTTSSLFYSLAFLYQTPGVMLDAIKKVSDDNKVFVYGISDRKVGGLDLQKPDGNVSPVFPSALGKKLPEPFKSEPVGGSGNRMHHKFLVVDFNKPTARVYLGSYNFSDTADTKNGENLLLIRNRRIAVSYMIEALRLVDHYHFRVSQQEAKSTRTRLQLAIPPRLPGKAAWWSKYYTNPLKIRDRE